MELITETLNDEIALQLSKGKAITEKSFLRWADKNRLTRSIRSLYLSERGIALDKLATNITREEQFNGYEEQDVIESIIDFMYEHPTRKDLNGYISQRKKEQTTRSRKAKPQGKFRNDDESCLLNSLRKELTDTEIIEEMTEYVEDPKNYFGKLLITTTCKKDFFEQPISEQKKIANDVLKKLKVKPSKKKKKKKPISLNAGFRKLALWISALK